MTRLLPMVACGLLGVAGPASRLQAQTVEPVVYEVEGVRVVQSTVPDGEIVAVRLYLLGGARQLTAETAGIERLVLRASERGTEAFPGNTTRDAQVATGSRFFVSTTADWSVIGFTGLAEEWEPSWTLLSERVVRPTLDSAALEVVRAQELTSVRAGSDDPDEQVRRLAADLAFAGHPYAVDVGGTEASLGSLQTSDLRSYHDRAFVRSRMLLAVVGPLDRSAVEASIRESLTELPLGSYAWELPRPWSANAPDVVSESRSLPTNYILGYFGGPTTDADDYPAFQIAVSALSGLISSRVRERGLSYAGGAPLLEWGAAGGGVYVSAVDPYATMGVINDAIAVVRGGSFQRSALQDYAEDSALSYYLANQTSAQQADFLATSLLLRGRPQSVQDWVETLKGVQGYQVRAAADRYMDNIQYGFLGSGEVPRDRMLRF
jgi:zinc protease